MKYRISVLDTLLKPCQAFSMKRRGGGGGGVMGTGRPKPLAAPPLLSRRPSLSWLSSLLAFFDYEILTIVTWFPLFLFPPSHLELLPLFLFPLLPTVPNRPAPLPAIVPCSHAPFPLVTHECVTLIFTADSRQLNLRGKQKSLSYWELKENSQE